MNLIMIGLLWEIRKWIYAALVGKMKMNEFASAPKNVKNIEFYCKMAFSIPQGLKFKIFSTSASDALPWEIPHHRFW